MDEGYVRSLILDLKDVEGCLSLFKTKDEDARRRFVDPVMDDDYYSLPFGRPYFNDSIMKLSISKATRRLGRTTQVMTKVSNAPKTSRGLRPPEKLWTFTTKLEGSKGVRESLIWQFNESANQQQESV